MAFTKMTTDVEHVQALADRPQMTAAALKQVFDTAGMDVKAYLNTLVDALNAVTAASNMGAAYVGDGDPNPEASRNVQGKLNYLYEQIKSAQAGQITDRSIEAIKIASETLTANELAANAVTTQKILDSAVTLAKLSMNPMEMLPIGYGMVWWSDTLPSSRWMMSGGTLTPGMHDAAIAFFGGTTLPDVKGRAIVGKDTSQAEFNELYRTGGQTETQFNLSDNGYAKIAVVGGAGGGVYSQGLRQNIPLKTGNRAPSTNVESVGAHSYGVGLGGKTDTGSILQPYIVANYIFKVL